LFAILCVGGGVILNKVCSKCRKEKSIDQFARHKYSKDGHKSYCKECGCLATKKYKANNSEKVKQAQKTYYENNKECVIEKSKAWARANKKHRKEYLKNYHAQHRESNNARSKAWREDNHSRFIERLKNWYNQNKEYCLEYARSNKGQISARALERYHNKYKFDTNYRINSLMATVIRRSIKNQKLGQHWESLVGYTLKELMKHIENQFQPGMTWENHGEWHIDHIYPKSKFNFSSPEDMEFKQCWGLNNLQPLWATDNLRKGNRVI
jgi:hypothetical protein